jgi:hypothetical protein
MNGADVGGDAELLGLNMLDAAHARTAEGQRLLSPSAACCSTSAPSGMKKVERGSLYIDNICRDRYSVTLTAARVGSKLHELC